ncbi:MAG TPA: RNA polymerase sigma factor [Bacillota bacterium]|nr:RNA polymerase sigma factor [Bacillota bacterium]
MVKNTHDVGGNFLDNGARNYRRFLEGDDDGLVEIVREYKDGLMLFLNTYVRNMTVAEDLAEDTFVRLVTKKPSFRGASSFRTWLYAIGRYVAIDHLRRASKETLMPMETAEKMSADDFLEQLELDYLKEERKIAIHRALSQLKQDYREVLWLLYFEELSYKDAARVMKKTHRSVEALAYRARKALKEILEDLEGEWNHEDL